MTKSTNHGKLRCKYVKRQTMIIYKMIALKYINYGKTIKIIMLKDINYGKTIKMITLKDINYVKV